MNKSYSKIRHIQNSNLLLEDRLLEWRSTFAGAVADYFGGFSKYPCVQSLPYNSKNQKIKEDKENKVYLYTDGTYISFDDAKDPSKRKGEYRTGTFFCEVDNVSGESTLSLQSNNPQESETSTKQNTTQSTTNTTQSTTNTTWASLPTKVSTIQKSLNITPSSQMDQATINAIMNKLNSGAKVETQKPAATTQTKNSEY
jgi:hypothetical protein